MKLSFFLVEKSPRNRTTNARSWQEMESYELEGKPRSESEQGRRIIRATKLLGISTDTLSNVPVILRRQNSEIVESLEMWTFGKKEGQRQRQKDRYQIMDRIKKSL